MATKDAPVNPMLDPLTGEQRVIAPGHTFKSVTEKISRIVLTPHTPLGWFAGFTLAGGVATMLLVAVVWLFLRGTGIGPSPSLWHGALPSSILCGGSVSATPER